MSLITKFYETYDEENRLTINNARKIYYLKDENDRIK